MAVAVAPPNVLQIIRAHATEGKTCQMVPDKLVDKAREGKALLAISERRERQARGEGGKEARISSELRLARLSKRLGGEGGVSERSDITHFNLCFLISRSRNDYYDLI